ncbi:DUF2147 domain-containing protein [bacterium]|nr:MAG: DUF2147 domain-containing protein [bacterium]
MKRLLVLAILLLPCLALAGDPVFPADAIFGIWETEHDEPDVRWSHIEVYEEGGKVHGRIVWLSHPVYDEGDPDGPAGQPVVDTENKDEALRSRPILGMELMRGFEHNGKNKWEDGHIYDPESGKDYRCKATLKDTDTLEVFGYVKVGFVKLGRDSIWKRLSPEVDDSQ